MKAQVAVLGAGLAGAGVALELARQGMPLALIDQDVRPVNRASLRNEGKIHLGFIYANDQTLRTARLMVSGALRFRLLLARWIGDRADRLSLSTPFLYVVARDSLSTVDALHEHYASVQSMAEEEFREDSRLDYLGRRPQTWFKRYAREKSERLFIGKSVIGAFDTEELAIDTQALAHDLRKAIAANPLIHFISGHRVHSVTRGNGSFSVEGSNESGSWQIAADQVVNALWENRLAIDASAGLEVRAGWLHRLKYRVIGRLPESLHGAPSVTMVVGRYGDVVIRGDGSAYLSWYPAGLLGWSKDLAPPETWSAACTGVVPDAKRQEIAQAILTGLSWYRGIGECRPVEVDAGAIVAYGESDVDDKNSGLHDRTRIGVTSTDGYHSLEPGKLTTAPMFSLFAAERVLVHAGRTPTSSSLLPAIDGYGSVDKPH